MKKTILLLALSLSGFLSYAQAPTIAWQKSLGGTGSDQASAVQQTTDGGYIVAGYSTSNDGDVSGNHGSNDIWITKLDALGSITWQKALGGSGSDQADAIQQTTDGGYIIAGRSNSTNGDVSGVHVSGTAADYWIVRVNATGNIIWQKALGGTRIDFARAIQQTADGHFIVAGSAQSSDGDIQLPRPGGTGTNHDFWVLKLNGATGDIIWQKTLGGTGGDQATSIQQTADGGYIVAGSTDSNNGDVTGYHGGSSSDYWVVKLDASGNITWQKALGGTSNDQASSVRQTTDGGYIVAGISSSNDGDVTGNHGSNDAWIVKLDASGNITWQKSIGGSSGDQARVIRQTNDGGYIVTGYTASNNTGDLTGMPFNGGIGDYWVIKLDDQGNITWQKVLGGTGYDDAWDVQQTADGNYIVAGTSNSNNNDVSGNRGNYDFWIVKLAVPCSPVTANATVEACGSYTWTGGNGQTYTANTTVTHTIPNGAINGCDSTVTLSIVINQPTGSTVNVVNCGAYTLNGQTYTASGTYTQTFTNTQNCDSTLTLNLTVNQPSATTINETICTGQAYTFGTQQLIAQGTYTLNLTGVNTCDSVITLHLTVTPALQSSLTETICAGESYTLGSQSHSSTGIYTHTFSTAGGCDSIVTLDLTVLPLNLTAITDHICHGETYTFGSQSLTQAGTYTERYTAVNGCDSLIELTLNVTTIDNSVTVNQNVLTAATASATYQWYNCETNSPIPSAISRSYTATENGSYAVVIGLNGCTSRSECVTVSGLSIHDVTGNGTISVFPNPSNGIFVIESNTNTTISISDISGKIVHTQPVINGVNYINIAFISKGIYFLRTNTGFVQKISIH